MDWPPGAHASTFGGNPVCVAAALATLRLMEKPTWRTPGAWANIFSIAWPNGAIRFGIVGEVRGKGLMIGIEIVKDQASKEPAPTCAMPS